MSLFLSTYVNKIDSKRRISVPAPFRTTLMNEKFQGVILFRSYKFSALEGCGFSRIEQMSHAVEAQTEVFSDAQDNLTAAIFADCIQLSFDGEGRIILPEDFCTFAQLNDKAAFVGRGQTFQIWSPEHFTVIQEQARSIIKNENTVLRMAFPLFSNESKL